ncbi:hypothetical protein K2173_015772 [Erythroxylum novogranatense]|uniref:Uncharacterized protein n=1 Tax=Erythroxylum novogranatense TaxID=1862640 RepID=A0AAV8SEZ1_9ROSI|nr:hypothetical protein K2173_015772 [Erythroxylum novogranatense]
MTSFNDEHGAISIIKNQNHSSFELDEGPHLPPIPANALSPTTELATSYLSSSDGDSLDNTDFSNAVLKYISDMLMEEDLEGEAPNLHDHLALQAAEKSFYDVLGQEYPKSSESLGFAQSNQSVLDDSSTWSSVDDSSNATAINLVESMWIFDLSELEPSCTENSFMVSFENHELDSCTESLSFCNSLIPVLNHEKDIRNLSNSTESTHRHRKTIAYSEGRSNKQSAVSIEEPEEFEILDTILLYQNESETCTHQNASKNEASVKSNKHTKGCDGRTARWKKRGKKRDLVDLWTLLYQCAEAVAGNDQKATTELVRQIRQHSSPYGDGNQRLAHYFADGLEARLAGTGTPGYTPHISIRIPAADLLRSYQVYVTACPFSRMSDFFAEQHIVKLAAKASRIHIIDFGILHGFQWPSLIENLSTRSGGPPKLRITGIEFPQPGFRPAERVDATGRRLRKFCQKFNIPFEYYGIAKRWETIRYEDLKIDRSEITVINCLYKLKTLPDDTMTMNSARDAVLKLMRRINPDIFIHGVVNGTYNAPFFLNRFRDAYYHFSAMFDMIDATFPREDQERLMIEKEVWGKHATNVVACEGGERLERPESYKQWRVRHQRAGFKQLPLDQEILKKMRTIVKSNYNDNFIVDEDGQWMLQGWKGRIIYALSALVPFEK